MCFKKWRHFFVCYILVIFMNGKLLNCFQKHDNKSISFAVVVSDSLLLTCSSLNVNGNYWIYEKSVINLGTFIIGSRFEKKMEVFENASLLISSVSLSDEGMYYCENNLTILDVHLLYVCGRYSHGYSKNFHY